jgi:hypothetical protein
LRERTAKIEITFAIKVRTFAENLASFARRGEKLALVGAVSSTHGTPIVRIEKKKRSAFSASLALVVLACRLSRLPLEGLTAKSQKV